MWRTVALNGSRVSTQGTCTMAKRLCSVGRACAAMQRSIHRVVRSVASAKRSAESATDDTTSSRAMRMSAPREFWMAMECSGVSSMEEPSTGDWKVTPASVTSARCNSDTIWKPPAAIRDSGIWSLSVSSEVYHQPYQTRNARCPIRWLSWRLYLDASKAHAAVHRDDLPLTVLHMLEEPGCTSSG